MRTQELSECPICSGHLAPLDIAEDYQIRAFSMRVSIEFAICLTCNFVCQSRVLPLDALRRYYRDSPKFREAVPSRTDRALHGAQAAFMRRVGELRLKRVLDIGADMGKLLDHLLAHYGCETYYEEYNRAAKAWLESSDRHTDASETGGDVVYDWIVLSQVLEHIVDPVPMLQQLRGRLAADGKLFVEVPHHGAWNDLDLGFSFEHVSYFSATILAAALDHAGYHLLNLEVTTDSRYFEGRFRIIRACAQRRAGDLLANPGQVVRNHHRKYILQRLVAIGALSSQLQDPSRSGLAVYGAAELADTLLRYFDASGGRIAAIFDSDVRKNGIEFGGLIVLSPAQIPTVNPEAILILSGAEADIRLTIAASGYTGRVICWSELTLERT